MSKLDGEDLTSQELAKAGKTGPRITREHIMAMLEQVEFRVSTVEGKTTTFVHAYLEGKFFLGTGFSACVDPANYVAEIGERIAREDAVNKAITKLWELEGYRLYQGLKKIPSQPEQPE